jgi:hypothetical protein
LPWALRQLSELVDEPAANALLATSAVANSTATLLSFFMFLLSQGKVQPGCGNTPYVTIT